MSFSSTMQFMRTGESASCSPIGLPSGYAGAQACGPAGCPDGYYCDANGQCQPFDLKPFPSGEYRGVHRLGQGSRRRKVEQTRGYAGG